MIALVFVVREELADHVVRHRLSEVRLSKQLVDCIRHFRAAFGRTIRAHPRVVEVTIQAPKSGCINA